MMCFPPWGYIVFTLRKLKFYEGRWLKTGNRGPDIRAGGWGRDKPNTRNPYFIIMSRTSFIVNLHSVVFLDVKELFAGRRSHI